MTPNANTELAHAVAGAMGDLLLEMTPAGVCVRSLGPSALLGLAHEKLAGKSLDELLPQASDRVRKACLDAVREGTPRTLAFGFEIDGRQRYLEARVAPGKDGNLLASLSDIEARFVEEQRLRASEELFRIMADSAPVMLWRADRTGDCDFFNRRWLEFSGRSMQAEVGVGWTVGIHPEDFEPCMSCYVTSFVARQAFRMEYRLRRADGVYRWILDQGVPRFSASGVFEGYIGSCVDVTDDREAARNVERLNGALQHRLEEREILLREVHHRVKNNLQLISSLLSLQARLLDESARNVVLEGQIRVHSIALVHEKLCESADVSQVDLGEYTRDLVVLLRRAVETPSRIAIDVDMPPLPLSIDQAILCGLIINELLTNALKHAFPGERSGSVLVQAQSLASDRIRLCVRDDGIGLPRELDLEQPSSMGMDLVAILARQLGAELQVERSPGSTFSFTFLRKR